MTQNLLDRDDGDARRRAELLLSKLTPISAAAKMFGLSRPTFWRLRRRHKIKSLPGRKVHIDDVITAIERERRSGRYLTMNPKSALSQRPSSYRAKKTTGLKFSSLPKTYSGLMSIAVPRLIRDRASYDSTMEIIHVLTGFKLNRDQQDYLMIMLKLIEYYERRKVSNPH